MPHILNGDIRPGRVFDRTVGLEDIPEGYRLMNDREALKVLLRPLTQTRGPTRSPRPCSTARPGRDGVAGARRLSPVRDGIMDRMSERDLARNRRIRGDR